MRTRWGGLLAAVAAAAVTTTALGGAGCGGGSGEGSAEAFVGRWMYASGTQTLTCPGLTPPTMTRQAVGLIAVMKGAGAAALVLDDLQGCTYAFSVAGKVASIAAGQTCASTVPLGARVAALTLMPSSLTLTLTATGMSQTGAGTATVASDTQSYPCTIEVDTALAKAPD